jgi:hypothetical protein
MIQPVGGSDDTHCTERGKPVAEWLEETQGKTIFEGDVLRIGEPQAGPNGEHAGGIEYDVQRGGWNFDPGPDTWLTEHVLARFEGRRVRITVEDLGPSPLMPHARPTS